MDSNFTVMARVEVSIVEYVDNSQPGFVRLLLEDATGKRWFIEEKLPIVTDKFLDNQSNYPVNGSIPCTIESEYKDDTGKSIVVIDISAPIQIQEISGKTVFDVFAEQVIRS